MAYARSLADGHRKVAILTTAPANPFAPTVAELNGGIDATARILASDWTFGATDSDKVSEKSLADINNVNALGASNFAAGATIFRYYDTVTGAPDATGDALWTATKSKGTTLYVYERESGKVATAGWATADIAFGMQILTDEPQKPSDTGGYIKRRIPMEPQTNYGLVTVT
jgi:hypothetical protein